MPARIQLSRAKGWRMPPNTVRVCRPGKWGNPFKIGDRVLRSSVAENDVAMLDITSQETAVVLHREWLLLALRNHPAIMLPALGELRGKNLACWCKPGTPCHADTLLELANQEPAK
ncbi:MAG TPA: DUF4326 domain-containing protein [Ramlibacter sp.]|nr:DUF4326 domain-containing protein [Ramlibacter sp.]